MDGFLEAFVLNIGDVLENFSEILKHSCILLKILMILLYIIQMAFMINICMQMISK
jgi:hypothetical protein